MSRTEIRELLGVSKAYVHKLQARPDFPAPVDVIERSGHSRAIWKTRDVERWARKSGFIDAE